MKKVFLMSVGMMLAASAMAVTAKQEASMVKASLVAPVKAELTPAIVDGVKGWTPDSPGRPTSY